MYVMYVTSSDEIDLFGKKPKISKVLATTKLDKATYPYQMHDIVVDNQRYEFNMKLSAEVEVNDDLFFIKYPNLNLEVWGDTREEAETAFNFALRSFVKTIYNEKNDQLTERAILLKKHFKSILKS